MWAKLCASCAFARAWAGEWAKETFLLFPSSPLPCAPKQGPAPASTMSAPGRCLGKSLSRATSPEARALGTHLLWCCNGSFLARWLNDIIQNFSVLSVFMQADLPPLWRSDQVKWGVFSRVKWRFALWPHRKDCFWFRSDSCFAAQHQLWFIPLLRHIINQIHTPGGNFTSRCLYLICSEGYPCAVYRGRKAQR